MQEQLESTITECKDYRRMVQQYENERFPSAGTANYVISTDWLEKYKRYVFYEEIKYNSTPAPEENHFTALHPGPITNASCLHSEEKFLKGTGTLVGFEKEVYDTYLHKDVREKQHFDYVNEEIWTFLNGKYGSDHVIKRYYQPKGTIYTYSEIDSRFVKVPVYIARADDLYAGSHNEESFKINFIQISGKKSFSDLKKRIADVVTAQVQSQSGDTTDKVKPNSLRLWIGRDKNTLLESFSAISKAAQQMEVDTPNGTNNSEDSKTEENSGVEFPGDSMEPYVPSSLCVDDHEFLNEVVIVEIGSPKFAYKYQDKGSYQVGVCEFCNTRNILAYMCKCKRVRYCKESCMKKDEHFHLPSCSAQADAELGKVKVQKRDPNSQDGIVGLQNLGNTCYMASSLQCLSNCYELTKFFLESRFSFIDELEQKNPLGTEGRLILAYAKLLNEMWNMRSNSVAPQMFKRILGEYAPTFAGYGQHDSHECINSILDLMGEDLYRKGKKPYVAQDENPNQSEEDAAKEAWHKHLLRNESIVTDLFHGQFKSTVCCSQCDRVSVTFDPMMSLSLPIPKKKESKDFFFLPYSITGDYINKSFKIKVGGSDNLRTLRQVLLQQYGITSGSFVIAAVYNNEFKKLHTNSANLLEVAEEQGATLMYEIDPALSPSLPDQAMRQDAMYNVDKDVTMLQLNISAWQKDTYSRRHERKLMLPRLLWVRKDMNLKEMHMFIFKHMRHVFSEWADWSHPETTRVPKANAFDLRRLVPFPYRLEEDVPMTAAQFDSLSDEDAYNLCFKGILEGDNFTSTQTHSGEFDIERMPYHLEFKNTSGHYAMCKNCDKSGCKNCSVPYSSDETVQDQLDKYGLKRNDTLFEQLSLNRGKEVIVGMVWHKDIIHHLFDFMATATEATRLESVVDDDNSRASAASNEIQLDQCLSDFKQSETLDEDNKWYCNKCQEHVQATKTLELYRVPRVLIISLKRFETRRSRYGYGGVGAKIETLVEFPLEGLDMKPYVLMPEQKNAPSLVYDCFGISNHMGSAGFGHYTAFAKNPINNRWYNFDDSHVSPINNGGRNMVTGHAYNLFFRLRSNDTMDSLNLDHLMQRPDTQFLASLEENKAAK